MNATLSPRVVGIDDWSWKRELRYGTLICDLETNKPIDVLADRPVPTVSAWFEERPSVEIVSRDRSSEYTAAISIGDGISSFSKQMFVDFSLFLPAQLERSLFSFL